VALATHCHVVPKLHVDKVIPPPLLYALNGMVMGCLYLYLYLYLYIRPVLSYLFILRFYCLEICCRIDVRFLYQVLGSLGVCDWLIYYNANVILDIVVCGVFGINGVSEVACATILS
jgi:hypothetical protein